MKILNRHHTERPKENVVFPISFPISYFFFIPLFYSSGLWPFATVGWPLGENDANSDLGMENIDLYVMLR